MHRQSRDIAKGNVCTAEPKAAKPNAADVPGRLLAERNSYSRPCEQSVKDCEDSANYRSSREKLFAHHQRTGAAE